MHLHTVYSSKIKLRLDWKQAEGAEPDQEHEGNHGEAAHDQESLDRGGGGQARHSLP